MPRRPCTDALARVAAPRRRRGAGLLALGLLWLGVAAEAAAQPPYPVYRLEAHLDREAHTLTGTVRIELGEADPRPRREWWLHLPPNRFLEKDPRGFRRATHAIPFAPRFAGEPAVDRMFPDGFSPGRIRILAVHDGQGRPVPHDLHDNAAVREGFSVRDGLLRARFPAGSPGRVLVVRFRTRLPHRHWDGWDARGVFAERWHPVLLNYRSGEWIRRVSEPAPGRYALRLTTDRRATVVPPARAPRPIGPERPLRLPLQAEPARTFPVIVVDAMEQARAEAGALQVHSLYRPGDTRTGELALEIGAGAAAYLRDHYGLAPPVEHLTLVQTAIPEGDPFATRGAVFIPRPDYHNTPWLDRVLLGRVARAVAQQWFGETLLADADRQAWFIYGLSGFVSLEFFAHLYGWDAAVHSITDWLAPRYREHYFEKPMRDLMRRERDAPVVTSLWHHPLPRTARVVVHDKAPLVIRQLNYVLGEDTFHRGLQRLLATHRHRPVDAAAFQQAMETAAERPLDWYFDAWFHGTPQLDYALAGWQQTPIDGGYRVRVRVRRLADGRMPLKVRLVTGDGTPVERRWPGIEPEATLVFETDKRVREVVLDPEEELLEIERRNNHSAANVRLRPFFDWSKNREVLVSVRGRAGGNAIDGNYVMIGANVTFNEDNELRFLPGYGQESGEPIYDVGWTRRRFLFPRLKLQLRQSRIGGRELFGAGLSYRHDTPPRMNLRSGLELRLEHVDRPPGGDGGGRSTNNVLWNEHWSHTTTASTHHVVDLGWERSREDYGSDFDYDIVKGSVTNGVTLGFDHTLLAEVIRAATYGTAPVQKKPLLGDPLVLRGYPRTLALVRDNIAAVRLDYEYVLSRAIVGREIQTRRTTGILFVDFGKAWDNDESPDDTPQRQNVGVGLEVAVNVMSQVEVPLRVEVARPVNDSEYDRTQYVFFRALAFF